MQVTPNCESISSPKRAALIPVTAAMNHMIPIINFHFVPPLICLGTCNSITFRYVSEIANQNVPGYCELDVRLAWQPRPNLELSIVGRNLLHDRHAEFGVPATRQEVERGVYGKVTWHF